MTCLQRHFEVANAANLLLLPSPLASAPPPPATAPPPLSTTTN